MDNDMTKDEYIRVTCLEAAAKTVQEDNTPGFEFTVIMRARYFEQYVRNGAFEGLEETNNAD